MTDEICKPLDAQPSVPFLVHAADGREFAVPTPDHAQIHPGGPRVTIYTDKGLLTVLPGPLVSGLAVEDSHPQPSV